MGPATENLMGSREPCRHCGQTPAQGHRLWCPVMNPSTDDPILPRPVPEDLRGRALIDWKQKERNRQRREYVIHEAGFLLDGGVRQDEIAATLDYSSVPSLQSTLLRWGREGHPEAARLARLFIASAWNVYAQSGMGRGKDVR